VEENLKLLREIRAGKYADGEHVRARRIDMASPNMNLRDPAMYRIRHAHHHRTGDRWCIYPTYDWAHGVSDALENITHSAVHARVRGSPALYNWFNERLAESWTGYDGVKRPGLLQTPLRGRSSSRGRTSPTSCSPSESSSSWSRRSTSTAGTTRACPRSSRAPARLHARGLPAVRRAHRMSKANQWIDFSVLEDCMRRAPQRGRAAARSRCSTR